MPETTYRGKVNDLTAAAPTAPGWPGDEPPLWQPGARFVAHMDLDSFYASVEEREDPLLAGKPVAVVMGLDQAGHGAVATASYAARARGVHSAQPLALARERCPDLIIVPVRRSLYAAYSGRVMAALRQVTGQMQQISIDEAFLEGESPASLWPRLLAARQQITEEIGLPCSFGLGPNKLVAKIATGQGKPRGFVVVPPGTEASFLAPLPVGRLWGVGPRTEALLHGRGIISLGDLQAREIESLVEVFGYRRALELRRGALGEDDSPLVTERRHQSISGEQTFNPAELDPGRLWLLLRGMAVDLAGRLAREGLVARTIGIKLRLQDWRLLTRDRTLPGAIDDPEQIAAVAADLMRRHWGRRPLRLLGLRVSGLTPKPLAAQLSLFS